jgi:hypothetical protein
MKSSLHDEQESSTHVYQMSSDEDYFYEHPNTVLLGYLGVVAVLLLVLLFALWIGSWIW